MKSTKLLGAVSAVAMLAGAANAQLTIDQVDTGVATTIDSFYELAEEVNFPQLALNGDADGVFGLEVRTQGVIPPGQNIFLTIEIVNGTLAANLDGSEITSGIVGAVVDAGGSIGDTSVRYLITTDTSDSSSVSGLDGIALDLPVLISSCGDTTFNVTEFRTEGTGSSGTDIEGGSAMLTSRGSGLPALRCADAYQANVFPDSDLTVLDFTTGFTNFVVSAPDTATTAVLGEYDLFVDTTVNIDLNSTPASPGDVLGFESSIDFDDGSGILSGVIAPDTGTLFDAGPTAQSFLSIPFVGTPDATLDFEEGTFTVTLNGINAVTPQEVTVSDANLFLDTSLALNAQDAFLFADVEDLRVNGQFYGFLDWVADANGFVNTIIRATGFDGQDDIQAQLIIKNAQGGAAYNGTYSFVVAASDVEGSEIRLTSNDLSAIVAASGSAPDGNFRTADVALVFSTDLDLDVDRLLSGPQTATVVPFGDGANQDGSGALAPAADPAGGVNGDDGSF
ncbi:MAG: hypothetical protein AAF296_01070 [Pseudomonadota bacterium]